MSDKQLLDQNDQELKTIVVPHPDTGLYLLKQIDHAHYKLQQQMLLDVEFGDDGTVLVSESQFESPLNVYGIGDTLEEAIADFVSMMIDLYEELKSSENILSNHLKKQLTTLRTIITSR